MKKNYLLFGLLGLAGLGAYFYFKKKGTDVNLSLKEPDETNEPTKDKPEEKVATVTAPINKIENAIEKGTEILSTVKEGIVEIKDQTGKIRAKVRKVKKRKKIRRPRKAKYMAPIE